MTQTLIASDWKNYELLDAGAGEKLEKFGNFIFRRPDVKVIWEKTLNLKVWQKIDAAFVQNETNGKWIINKQLPESWNLNWKNLTFQIKLTNFKHVGIFPEMAALWDIIIKKIENVNRSAKILNLFAYTGGFSLAASAAGASVAHVDASKSTVRWASENARLSGMSQKPIRWIVDDAHAFVSREIKRGNKYDAIIMDPPKFGRGTNLEFWKIEKDLGTLLVDCKKLLSDHPLFVLVNAYTVSFSSLSLANLMQQVFGNRGEVSHGELAIKSASSEFLLPTSIFGLWEKGLS